MSILAKYMLKNVFEKKFRTLIVLISIMISSALFYASYEISDTMVKISTDRLRQYVGTSDIVIRPNDKSTNPYFSTAGADPYKNQLQYSIGAIEDRGQYVHDSDSVNVQLLGMDSQDMQTMNPVALATNADWNSFTGNEIVISQRTAQAYDLHQGETFSLKVHGKDTSFDIFAIAKPVGLFQEDGGNTFGLVPKAALQDIVQANGDVNAMFLKVKPTTDVNSMIQKLTDAFPSYLVSQTISDVEIKSQVGAVANTFLLMTIIVSLLSMFIINSSIKVIVFERMPIIGTFRSIGSTKKMTGYLLLWESVLYGVLGGALGCALGVGILYLMTDILNSGASGSVTVEIKPYRLAIAFVMAVVLPLLSSLFPVLKASKTPLKDIILNKSGDEPRRKNGVLRLIIGLVLMVAAVIVTPQLPRSLALPVGAALVILNMVGISLITPFLLKTFSRVFEKPVGGVFGNVGVLALKNIRENKSTMTNITLLSISIATMLMINIVGNGVVVEMTNFYATTPMYDLNASADKMDDAFVDQVKNLDGVQGVYAAYQEKNVVVKDKQGGIGIIEGADQDHFGDYWHYDMSGDSQTLISQLQTGRNILLTNMLQNKFGVQVGDKITLEMKQGDEEYTVIGFMNTPRNSGNYAVISADNLKTDSATTYYSQLYLKTKPNIDPETVAKAFNKDFYNNQGSAKTKQAIAKIDSQNSQQQFTILKGFSLLALLISVLSIVNNLVILFIQRQRALAMYRSIGMSKSQIVKMVMIEAVGGGFLGSMAGMVGGVVLISAVPYILRAIDQRVVIHYSLSVLVYTFVAGVLVTVVASLVPAAKSSRLNIIQSIKME